MSGAWVIQRRGSNIIKRIAWYSLASAARTQAEHLNAGYDTSTYGVEEAWEPQQL